MKLLLYGASGHGRVVNEIIHADGNFDVIGFIDDDLLKKGQLIDGVPIIGSSEELPSLIANHVENVIITIGQNSVRLRKTVELQKMGFRLPVAVHPKAVVATGVQVGAGSVLMAGAIVNPGACIGKGVILNTGATVDHDCILGDGVHLSPGVHLAGGVSVGEEAHVGIGAVVIQNINIGKKSVVGAGSVVIRDIPLDTTVVGNPAREIPGTKRD